MRVLCLVPSLTETLAVCGVNLVGRTRFCVHPEDRIKSLPVVGGTKDLNWQKLKDLKPDLLILDREENLPWMRDEAPCRVHVVHATGVEVMGSELRLLSHVLGDVPALLILAEAYERIAEQAPLVWNWARIPGAVDSQPVHSDLKIQKMHYVIWKNPWMRVGPGTYIHSVLRKLGAGEWLASGTEKYPRFDLELERKEGTTLFLFSSEPYPFAREIENLRQAQVQGLVVDGEAYGWFGLRSLRFLEREYARSES